MTIELGMIEGRFGPIWSCTDRLGVLDQLACAGYAFYHYAPKADRHLRRDWREPHGAEAAAGLARFSAAVRARGMRFGVALTPAGVGPDFTAETRAALTRRVRQLGRIGLDDLVILFDDLRGDVPGLARFQIDAVHHCAAITGADRIYFCPTYYSDDPVLDRAFGTRPADYLARLGREVDPAIRIYWTGEEVCAREIGIAHLERVNAILRRKVCLWDNYPVNDGPRMSRRLHLRAFTGRPARIAPLLSGHAINPAIQPLLSCLPAISLADSYRLGDGYAYGEAFRTLAPRLFGPETAHLLQRDLLTFQDGGYDAMDAERRRELASEYRAVNAPAAREVAEWLEGRALMSAEEVRTQ